MAEERLQKILSKAGIASRRAAEELIVTGLVAVNGKVITELGAKADFERDHIKVRGKLIHAPRRLVYLAFHKPDNCVTTLTDPQRRRTVMDFIGGIKERVYPAGRLDYHSTGLLLLTNDGEFANRITSAKHHVTKTYQVKVTGTLTLEQEEKFRTGIPLSGKRTAPAGLTMIKPGENPWYEVKLVEGRQNQIRLMFKSQGRLVEKLRRTKIGFLDLKGLKPGAFRELTPAEIARFKKLLKMEDPSSDKSSGK